MNGTRRGFALLAGLWLMVMLSGLGLHVAIAARADRLAAASRLEGLLVRAGADAGVAHARTRLAARLRPTSVGDAPAAVAPHPWYDPPRIFLDTVELGPVRYAVRLRDANALLNLNSATEAELLALMVALGVDAGQADRAAQAIVDWRDPDGLRHPRGAERDEYLRNGARALPPDAPFSNPEELRDVFEMTARLYELLRPHVTVAGSGRVNPNTADTPVLRALPGFTPEVVAALIRLRASGILFSSADQLLAALPAAVRSRLADRAGEWRPRLSYETREIEFESVAWMDGNPARGTVQGTFTRAGTGVFTSARRAR
jgi:general secretion pathway protein K